MMRWVVKHWLVVGLLLGSTAYVIAEELTLTTYYPSPRGVYNELRTQGDVAIGDINPPNPVPARLYVVGDPGAAALRVDVGGNPAMIVNSNGNVGIGTSSPSAKLHVSGGDIDAGGGGLINLRHPPSNPSDAATKRYVDDQIAAAISAIPPPSAGLVTCCSSCSTWGVAACTWSGSGGSVVASSCGGGVWLPDGGLPLCP